MSTSSMRQRGPIAIAAKMSRVEKHIRKTALQVVVLTFFVFNVVAY